MIQKCNQRRKFHLQPKRGPRAVTLRETQRYFGRFHRKPVTLPKVTLQEASRG